MAGYIQYFKKHNIEYADFRVSNWDKNQAKVTKDSKYIGRVLDKENLIFKNRADGVFQFDPATQEKRPAPENFKMPIIKNKPRGISLKFMQQAANQATNQAPSSKSDAFPTVLSFGEEFVYDKLINTYLADGIGSLTGVNLDSVKALVMYYCLSKDSNAGAADWLEDSYAKVLYPTANLRGPKITEMLKALGTDAQKNSFLAAFAKTLRDKLGIPANRVAIDSTGLQNDSKLSLTAISHHNGAFENEIRLIFVVDQDTGLPLYYRCFPSNVPDMKTLETTFNHLKELSLTPKYVVVDAGYSYKENIDLYSGFNIDFLTRIPVSRKLYKELIEKYYDTMLNEPSNFVRYNGRLLCIKKVPAMLDGKNSQVNGFAYICVDLARQAIEMEKATRKFLCGEIEEDELVRLRRRAGVFILAGTRDDLTAQELLPSYYARQDIEQTFDTGKNDASMLPLNVQTDASFAGHMLIAYMSTILQKVFQKFMATNFKKSAPEIRRSLRHHKAHLKQDKIELSDVAGVPMEIYKKLGLSTENKLPYPRAYLDMVNKA